MFLACRRLAGVLRGQPEPVIKAVSPQEHIPNAKDRAVPQYLLRGTKIRLISDPDVQAFADALKAAGQTAEYVQVEGASHAFFDWKPDANTKATFAKYGVPVRGQDEEFLRRGFLSPGQNSGEVDFGPWTLDLGLWTLDFGPWTWHQTGHSTLHVQSGLNRCSSATSNPK